MKYETLQMINRANNNIKKGTLYVRCVKCNEGLTMGKCIKCEREKLNGLQLWRSWTNVNRRIKSSFGMGGTTSRRLSIIGG